MKNSLLRLQHLLTDKGYEKAIVDAFTAYLEHIGQGLVYPNSIALKLQIAPSLANELLLIACAANIYAHYVVPKHNGDILINNIIKGFTFPDSIAISDPDDFEELDHKDLEFISGYKLTSL